MNPFRRRRRAGRGARTGDNAGLPCPLETLHLIPSALYYYGSREGQAAARERLGVRGRKVRTPQGRMPGNPRAAQADGKCHRKHTAGRCSVFGGELPGNSLKNASAFSVRVKRQGKSLPRHRQRRRHGKPHPVQGQIGAESRWPASSKKLGPTEFPARVGRLRSAATRFPDRWLPRESSFLTARRFVRQNSAYRPSRFSPSKSMRSATTGKWSEGYFPLRLNVTVSIAFAATGPRTSIQSILAPSRRGVPVKP